VHPPPRPHSQPLPNPSRPPNPTSNCSIVNRGLEEFAKQAPTPDSSDTTDYDESITNLESMLDTPLQSLYQKQLTMLRLQAVNKFKVESQSPGTSDAMSSADDFFVNSAEAATRPGGDWSYATERKSLQSHMSDLSLSNKRFSDAALKHSTDSSTAMQFLQHQQQTIQQLQMQMYGQSSPWNAGFAFRLPETNINLQGNYQQGRGNFVLSCVPDEYAAMLGPNGFTNGVGPGNLGLSVNLSL